MFFFPHQPIYAIEWTKYYKNPIYTYTPGSWDGTQVANPFILHLGDNYYNLYQGSQTRWNIGLTQSSDGINNWSVSQHLLSPGTLDGWEVDLSDPTALFENDKYKMWYSSSTENWVSGLDRFRLGYLESLNISSWSKTDDWVLKGTLGSWDEGGIARGSSILHINNIYHLWYAGTNTNNVVTNPFWRIGYATSTDGIHWIKENSNNPVIAPTKNWDLNNVSYPTVLYQNGLYHLWYGSGLGDMPTQISYAYSKDGIVWIKPDDRNPVLVKGPNGFDSVNLMPHSVLLENGILKMWYSGYDGFHWRIGYATTSASFLPTPDPDTVPTAIPTPRPPPATKVVIVPGFGGSWNSKAIIQCTLNSSVGNWGTIDELLPGTDPYIPLLESFKSSNIKPIIFYYDWRNQSTINATALKVFINSIIETPGERVHLIGHSLGGLISRLYEETNWFDNRLDHLFLVAAPFDGTVLAYPAWSGGEVWWNDYGQRIAMTIILKWCGLKSGKTDRQVIQNLIPSVQNLLPRFQFLNSTDNVLKYSAYAKNNLSFHSSTSNNINGTIIGTLSGSGTNTLSKIVYKNPTNKDVRMGNWLDGKPYKTIDSAIGDGTVLTSSSQIPGLGLANQVLSKNHTDLINSQEGIQKIFDFLSITNFSILYYTPKPFINAFIIISYPDSFTLTDVKSNTQKDKNGFIGRVNPTPGNYNINFDTKNETGRYVIAQFFSNGKSLWKEYSRTEILNKKGIFLFNPNNPNEDPLQ